MTMELTIKLPKPHPKQHSIRASKAKRKVVCSGRRGGKTTAAAIASVEAALDGKRVLFAAPTDDQIDMYWTICKNALDEPIQAGKVYKNETKHILEFPNKARIRGKTAWNADTLRGDYADLLILEEFALMDANAWDQVGSPMLLDNDGDAWFISTPKRRNHFFTMYQRGVSDNDRWQAWHFTSYDNPHLSQEALGEITADMTESAYRQEIMAEFLEGEGQVFRNIAACLHAPKATPAEHAGHTIVAGLDWAKHQDHTATSVVCSDCRVEVDRDRFNKIDFHFQRQRLQALYERWGVARIEGELNSIGEPNLEELARAGLPIVGFQTTASSKPPLIESLALALEKVECQWQADPIWTGELEAYEMKTSANTGRPTYSAPQGLNDDTVIARALAWRAVTNRATLDYYQHNPFYG